MSEQGTHQRILLGFDPDAIHAGNRGLAIDHDAVSAAVEDLLGQMTLDQKLNEIHGLQAEPIDGLYHAGGDAELGIPTFRMVDGPRGARAGHATAFPVAMARGATFDPALEKRVGEAIGLEVAAKGGNVLLAPTINLLRHPGWGRAQETYSEDSHHMGAMAVAFVSGVQNHVLASPKHYALNNVEMTRFEMSANVDERTLHEVYLPHFRRCVQDAAAASVMSAYNKVNGIYCGEHPYLLTEVLRERWGFRGFVESDWFLGTRSTAAAINAGLDIEMPAAYRFTREKLDAAFAAGEIDEAVIDRNVRRILYQKLAWDLANPPPVPESVVECAEHRSLAREVAEKSFVLLKNEGVLPLAPTIRLAVVGALADTENLGDRGSSFVTSSEVITPLAGLHAYGDGLEVTYFGDEIDPDALAEHDVCLVVAGLTYREEGEYIPTAQQEAEGGHLARGGDRADLRLPAGQEDLIRRAAAAARKTVVALEGGSAIEVTPWIDAVDALLMIWYPGCQGGHALARVLFGDVSPSGRLPVSFPHSARHLVDWDIHALDVRHDLYHGYRHLDRTGQPALYPFGFGLSYTGFELTEFSATREQDGFVFQVTVTNTGERAGATTPQLYVSWTDSGVERVDKELKGFGRVELEPGEAAALQIRVADADLCYYHPDRAWVLEPCTYRFRLGDSAAELPLERRWRFDGTSWQDLSHA